MFDALSRHLQLRTPLLWVTSDEALSVIDAVATVSDRTLYRLDSIDGLLVFQENEWVIVLVEDEDNPEQLVPITSFHASAMYVLRQKGVMIVENADAVVKPLLGFLTHLSQHWMRGIQNDNQDKMPASFILISYKQEVPPELRRLVVKYEHPLPTAAELEAIVTSMYSLAELPSLHRSQLHKIGRAATGMGSFEFYHTAAKSLAEEGVLNHESINAAKLHILAQDGVLNMRVPQMTMRNIGGMDHAKHIMQRTTWIWQNPEEARKLDIEPLRKILLLGVPGSGKSALCEATATELGLELAKFGVGAMMNKFVGESEANMRRAFAQIKAMAPLCLWIDELGRDFSGGQSSGTVDGGTTDRVHGEMLQGLQELPENVFLVCAANRIDDLPPEMLRADRFDKILFVGFPTMVERQDIFQIHLGSRAVEYDLPALANATMRFTGAEIKALIRETRFEISAIYHRPPTTEEIIHQAGMMKGLIWNNHRDAMLAMYKKALTEWDWASTAQFQEAQLQYGAASQPAQPQSIKQEIPVLSARNVFKGK